MKVIVFFLFIFLVVVFQGTIFDSLSLYNIKPDFPLIFSFGIGLYRGEIKGLLLGGIIGLLMDSSTGILLGPNFTSKATVGFLSGYLRRKIFRINAGVGFIFLFILSLLDGIMNFFSINIFLGASSFPKAFSAIILPQAIYSSLIGTIILILVERLKSKDDRKS